MSYTINKFNGEPLVVLNDGTIDVSTSVKLVGRSYVGYGEIQNENFVFLMENFANKNAPARPVSGQTWFDTDKNLLNVYDGEKWNVIGSAQLSANAPEGANIGYLWLKTPENVLYVWDGATWAFIGPEKVPGFGTTKAESTTLLDTDNQTNPVILLTINDSIIGICSEKEFIINPLTPISGFTVVVEGITLSNNSLIRARLSGLADRALRLDVSRNINGVAFNGTSDITIKSSTTQSLIAGNFILGNNFNGTVAQTWGVDATSANIIGKVVVRNSQGGFAAGTITADLVGNVIGNVTATAGSSKFDTIEANRFIGTVLAGNADTATRLTTARTINGVAFNGTQDITVLSNAETLTGTFLRSTIVNSNLQTLGTIQSLNVLNPGVVVGNAGQFKVSIEPNTRPTLRASGSFMDLIVDAGGPNISLIGSIESQNLGGPASPAIVSNNAVNMGLPGKEFDQIFANNFRGLADTATVAVTANNLSAGGPQSLPYQTSTGVTAMLPIGTNNQILKVVDGQLKWENPAFENLTPGNFIIGASYNTATPKTWSVDATANNTADKIVARNSDGDFAAGTITAELNGNSATTTKLETARLINGVPFDGTANINANYTITFGNTVSSTSGFTNQVGSFNNNANYFDVFPPAGKTMTSLVAFIPSIAVIHYAGNVNADDSMRCTWTNFGDRIRVWVQNTEQRSTPAANFLAIWS